MSTLSLSYISNLPEVGAPIRDSARDIEMRMAMARQSLERAQRDYADAIAELDRDAARLNAQVTRLWTAEEILGAKRAAGVVGCETCKWQKGRYCARPGGNECMWEREVFGRGVATWAHWESR